MLKISSIVLAIAALITFTFLLTSCGKDSKQSEIDEKLIVDYLTEKNKLQDAIRTEDGMYYWFITETQGGKPNLWNKVTVHYEGTLLDGTVFDSSRSGNMVQFTLRTLIEGWQKGLQLMSPGSRAVFVIPSHLGYGSRSTGSIPKNSVLVFDVELFRIE